MKYLVDTLNNSKNISNRIALEQNCDGIKTAYWFGWVKHAQREEYALCVIEEEQNKLNESEQQQLKSHEELEIDGWFKID